MSDDFDNDLSWLDDDPGSDDSSDDDIPDWLRADSEDAEPARTEEPLADLEAMRRARQQQQQQEPEPAKPDEDESGEFMDDMPDWLQGIGEDEAHVEPTTKIDYVGDVPEWMQEEFFDEDTEQSLDLIGGADDDIYEADAVPDWMAGDTGGDDFGDEEDAVPDWTPGDVGGDEPEDDAVPDWLAGGAGGDDGGDDDSDALGWMAGGDDDGGDDFEDEEDAVPDWMAGDTGGDDFEDEEDAIPDWIAGETSDDEDEADAVPEWMAGDVGGDEPEEDVVPDWMAGDTGGGEDEEEEEEVPDWLMGGDEPEDEAAEEELPPWLAGEPEAAGESPAPSASVDDDFDAVPDWIDQEEPAAAPEPVAIQPSDFSDMFGADDFDFDDDEAFDLLGDLSDEAAELETLLGDAGDEFDLLGELTGGAGAAGDDEEEDAGADVLAAMLGGDEGEDVGEDDLFAELVGEEDAGEPEALEIEDFTAEEEPLAEMEDLEGLFEGELDEEDFLTEIEAPEPEPALEPVDDLSALFDEDEETVEEVEFEEEAFDFEAPPSAEAIEEAFEEFDAGEAAAEFEEPDFDEFVADFEEEDAEREDWFDEEEEPEAAVEEAPDWLGEIDEEAFDFEEEIEEAPVSELEPADEDLLPTTEEEDDFELGSFLDSLSTDADIEMPRAVETPSFAADADEDFDALFDSPELADIGEDQEAGGLPVEFAPDAPEWLADLSSEAAGGASAAAAVRGMKERPVEDLPGYLQYLHDRGLNIPSPPAGAVTGTPLAKVLGDVKNTLVPLAVDMSAATSMVSGAVLSDEQEARAHILQAVAGSSLDEEVEEKRAGRIPRLRIKWQPVIAVILAGLMALPFLVDSLQVGELPPPVFANNSRQMAFVQRVQNLTPQELVLVAIEYGPTGAAELDDATEALLLHTLQRGAVPVVVGGNPVGMLRAQNIMDRIAAANGGALVPNRDYVIGTYIVGDAVGLRTFNENIADYVENDLNGDETGLVVESLDDFALIVIITERSDRTRIWGEQVKPNTQTPIVAVMGQAAAPLSLPYVDANPGAIAGALVGYRDSYTYREMVGSLLVGAGEIVPPTETPAETETVTPEPTQEIVVEVTEEPVVEATEEPATSTPQPTPTREVSPTDTPEPEAQVAPTDTPAPTETTAPTDIPAPSRTPVPTATPEPVYVVVVTAGSAVNVRSGPSTTNSPVAIMQPGEEALILGESEDGSWYNILLENAVEGWISETVVSVEEFDTGATPEAIPDLIEVAIVIADSNVNIRSGPSTSGGAVAVAAPGDQLVVIGRNEDESWVNVLLEDGTEGWIAAFLVRIELVTPPDEEANAGFDKGAAQVSKPLALLRRSPAQDQNDGRSIAAPVDEEDDYRDERWYSMTIGLLAAIVLIVVGNIMGIIRALLRRRRD